MDFVIPLADVKLNYGNGTVSFKAITAKKTISYHTPRKVIRNGPATVVLWHDDTKTVTKAGDGDAYDPLVGLLLCCYRKNSRNRGRAERWEGVFRQVSAACPTSKELLFLGKAFVSAADGMDMEGR